jgi:hypothetical protein
MKILKLMRSLPASRTTAVWSTARMTLLGLESGGMLVSLRLHLVGGRT